MKHAFHRLGGWVHRHRLWVIAAWLIVLVLGGIGAGRLPAALLGGSGDIAGSASERVARVLRDEFANPFSHLLLVTFTSESETLDSPAYRDRILQVAGVLRAQPEVRRVVTPLEVPDARLRSQDGRQAVLMVGLNAETREAEEQAVPRLRKALAPLATAGASPAFAVTGHSAVTYDINDYNKRDGEVAEAKALPLTLLILLIAFGSLAAAGVPLIVGIVTTTVALGLAYGLSHFLPLSNLLQNIVTMIGLAIGIDYSLLIVSRYRELREGRTPEEAIAEVVSTAGVAVCYSGLTVMIGLLGLLFTPLMETRSIGLGGAIVVVVSVLAAVTLLPAVVSLLGPRIDWPAWLARPLRNARAEAAWERLAEAVMRRPVLTLVVAGAIALLMALPATQAKTGFISGNWFPKGMESRTGLEMLGAMGQANAIIPIDVIVRAPAGTQVVSSETLPHLLRLSRDLKADERVGQVLSPVDLRPDLKPIHYALLYRNPDRAIAQYPQIGELLLSRDRSAALFQVIPSATTTIEGAQALARELGTREPGGGLALEVGGTPQYYNDFNDRMRASFAPAVGLVIGVTLVVLFFAYRSWLIPIKAVLMNLLAVGAGYGALVAVFQFGWGRELIGLEAPLSAIPLTIPLMIFCITFGLSMDYEIFLLSRIKEVYDETGDNRLATARGLATTGSIITSAALVMAVVFGAFAGAEIAILKMIGLGLAVAVLVDATLIRALMVPAFMAIAGRWNWVPGDRHRPANPVS